MGTMTVRTSIAFDPASAACLERLAKRWGVSKSEVLRRSLAEAEKNAGPAADKHPDFSTMTPLQILDWLAANPQVPAGWGESHRRELREMRELDAELEQERQHERTQTKVAEPSQPYPG